MLVYKFSTALALIVTIIWSINKPDYDSIVSTVIAFGAFAYVFFAHRPSDPVAQRQDITSGGAGIQAGRDANNARIDKKN